MLADIRRAGLAALAVALLAPSLAAAAGALGLKAAKATVQSADGVGDATFPLAGGKGWAEPIALAESSKLKIAFSIVDTATDEAVVPQQAYIVFEDEERGTDVTVQLGVKDNGKASYILNAAKPLKSLAASSGSLRVSLILSNGEKQTPLSQDLGLISLPPSVLTPSRRTRHQLPPRAGEPAFVAQEELFHTFRPAEKEIAFPKAAAGAAAVVAPWLLLIVLVGKVSSNIQFGAPPAMVYAFLGCLFALEGLILRYWIGWRLYQLLPPFIVLSGATAYVGAVALRGTRAERLKAGGKP